jgi:hypothetical protein
LERVLSGTDSFPDMPAIARRLLSSLNPGWGGARPETDAHDWRVRAAFDDATGVDDLFDRLRGREQVLGSEVGGLLPFGVVLSRDDDVLFAYASTSSGIDGARRTIERVVHAAGLSADLCVSHWDGRVREWRRVDPPLSDRDRELDEARAREAMRHETRELSCLVGRLDRAVIERLILNLAQRRGLDCTVGEERRLLSVRLTFSVSGPAFMLDQFVDDVRLVVKSHRWPAAGGG